MAPSIKRKMGGEIDISKKLLDEGEYQTIFHIDGTIFDIGTYTLSLHEHKSCVDTQDM